MGFFQPFYIRVGHIVGYKLFEGTAKVLAS